ncbi:hypothetical protein F5148DRAFT_1153561 [Russula earlei]|uniref:Uncharacterized protein n=1 Tax=Russula earlei TaxID=71964 RepID=A0ACC0TU28_9AGAM|nr:hypothetical protein F5148DRAFT_1153561 [Russula earlei]
MEQPPQFLTYARFQSAKEAEELTSFLLKHQIAFQVEEDKDVLDKIYIGESFDPMTLLKIKSTDFERLNNLVITELEVDDSQCVHPANGITSTGPLQRNFYQQNKLPYPGILLWWTPTSINLPGYPQTGTLIGYMTIKATKTLPNGQSVKMYDEHTRDHALVILFIGLVWLVLLVFQHFF